MYLEHYGLRELPFSLTPDTSFFFGYGHYRDAFNTLTVALQGGEGFIKVTGEVGTGKTLLCRKLLNSLDKEYATAYIPNPYLSPSGLVNAVADELQVAIDASEGTHRALKAISERLIALNGEGRKVVLCIDEAQAMPEQTLETLRLITNLETEKHKLLQVVLFGQPELDERLAQKSIRQLRQRITFSYTLQPLDTAGLGAYLQHRLLIAGGNGEVGFDEDAIKLLYRGSRGFPRLVNILAHKALMLGYGQGIHRIGSAQIKAAIADTEGAEVTRMGHRTPLYATAALLMLVVLTLLGYRLLPDPLHAATQVSTTPSIPVASPQQPVSSIAQALLTGVTPQRVHGSYAPQQLLVHGQSLKQETQLLVSWSGREKLLPHTQVEWLDEQTLRIRLITGVHDDQWQVQLIHPDGSRGSPVGFDVLAPVQSSGE